MKYAFLILSSLILVSCASTEEETACKETAWLDYGFKTAMNGFDLKGDDLVKQCKAQKLNMDEIAYDIGYAKGLKNYCTKDTTYKVGREGKEFNFQICKFENEDDMRVAHSNGVIVYCNGNNAYKSGFAGEVFNNICPKNLSGAYKSEFNRGRRKFLMVQIQSKQREIESIDHEQANIKLKQNRVVKQLNGNTLTPPNKRKEMSLSIDAYEDKINQLKLKKNSIQEKLKDYEKLIIEANKANSY